MWLGDQFWKISGANRTALQSCNGVVVTELPHVVTRIGTALDVFRGVLMGIHDRWCRGWRWHVMA